jgi:glycosyltransferase involved in cell wall biosynthesis
MDDRMGLRPPDFYLACHCNVHGWGGGLAFATGLQTAFELLGYSSLMLGVEDGDEPEPAPERSCSRANLRSGVPPNLWRIRSWCLPWMMSQRLRRLPPPRVAAVCVSPTWVVAARYTWPDVPIVFLFACLLTNCLPFTWPDRRPGSIWGRLDYAGVRRTERRALTRADLILAPTRQSVDEIQAFWPRCARRVERCDYGVCPIEATPQLREPKRREIGAERYSFVIALVGHCDRNKGFDLAIRALPDVDRRGRLLIIGDGPELDSLRSLASSLGVVDRITLPGPQRSMAPWYAAADCVLSTSYYDTFPNVLLEAMYLGLPVLVPEHDPPQVYSGMAEVVREHGSGLLYPRSDPARLAMCVNRLIRDPDQAAALGTRGRRAVQQRFRWQTTARRILEHCGIGQPGSLARDEAFATAT